MKVPYAASWFSFRSRVDGVDAADLYLRCSEIKFKTQVWNDKRTQKRMREEKSFGEEEQIVPHCRRLAFVSGKGDIDGTALQRRLLIEELKQPSPGYVLGPRHWQAWPQFFRFILRQKERPGLASITDAEDVIKSALPPSQLHCSKQTNSALEHQCQWYFFLWLAINTSNNDNVERFFQIKKRRVSWNETAHSFSQIYSLLLHSWASHKAEWSDLISLVQYHGFANAHSCPKILGSRKPAGSMRSYQDTSQVGSSLHMVIV